MTFTTSLDRARENLTQAEEFLAKQKELIHYYWDPCLRAQQYHTVAIATQAIADAKLRVLVERKNHLILQPRMPELQNEIEKLEQDEKSASKEAYLAKEIASIKKQEANQMTLCSKAWTIVRAALFML